MKMVKMMSKVLSVKDISTRCKNFRKANNLSTQDVAALTKYSAWSVYAFEQGRLNSLTMLMAYVALGFKDFDETDIFGGDTDGEKR